MDTYKKFIHETTPQPIGSCEIDGLPGTSAVELLVAVAGPDCLLFGMGINHTNL